MQGFLIDMARSAGQIAMEHFRSDRLGHGLLCKGRGDYTTYVDRAVEEAITSRIRQAFPGHRVLGEEMHGHWPSQVDGPCWIVDPIDGTTNFLRGLPGWAVSICYCDQQAQPCLAAVFDPLQQELFLAERGGGLWLGDRQLRTSGQQDLERALVSMPFPFRVTEPFAEAAAVITGLLPRIEDQRRIGSAALDLAYVAVGRLDAYWELGIHAWDTAAGELLVMAGGGLATDFHGRTEGLLGRRSVLAAATPALHATLLAEVGRLAHWLDHPLYAPRPGPAPC